MAAGVLCALLAGMPLLTSSTQASADDIAERLADCQDDEIDNDERRTICSHIIDDASHPEDVRAEALLNRGIVFLEENKPAQAMADFEEAVRLNPTYPAAYAYRGEASKATGQLARALEDYDKAISLDDASSDLYAYRGDIHLKLGERDKARADFQAALKLERGHDVATAGMKALERK